MSPLPNHLVKKHILPRIGIPTKNLIMMGVRPKPMSSVKKGKFLLKNPPMTPKGALLFISTGKRNDANIYTRAIPKEYKNLLFPGYAGFMNARSYFSNYGPEQRYDRLQEILRQGEKKLMHKIKMMLDRKMI